MKRMTIKKYLEDNCVCNPDSKDYKSVCGFKCDAKYHYSDEIRRKKLLFSITNSKER